MGSEPLSYSKEDLLKIARGAAYAMSGALLIAIGLFLQTGKFDLNLFLGALGSILINAAHKYFADTNA
jgi:hypothetical protein